jgi:hypothetical protein
LDLFLDHVQPRTVQKINPIEPARDTLNVQHNSARCTEWHDQGACKGYGGQLSCMASFFSSSKPFHRTSSFLMALLSVNTLTTFSPLPLPIELPATLTCTGHTVLFLGLFCFVFVWARKPGWVWRIGTHGPKVKPSKRQRPSLGRTSGCDHRPAWPSMQIRGSASNAGRGASCILLSRLPMAPVHMHQPGCRHTATDTQSQHSHRGDTYIGRQATMSHGAHSLGWGWGHSPF